MPQPADFWSDVVPFAGGLATRREAAQELMDAGMSLGDAVAALARLAPATMAGGAGAKGDLDPEGRWVTVQGQHVHIDGQGNVEAGGHPELRKAMEGRAGRGEAEAPAAASPPPARGGTDYGPQAGVPAGGFGPSDVRPAFGAGSIPHELAVAAQEWASGLPDDQYDGLRSYTTGRYERLNAAMRQCPETLDCLDNEKKALGNNMTDRETALAVSRAIESFPKPAEPLTAWRGLAVKSPEKLAGIEAGLKAALASGEPVTFAGFSSASFDSGVANHFGGEVVLEIRSRQGAYIKYASQHSTEYEYLLPHNARLKVVAVHEDAKFARPEGMGKPEGRRVYVLEDADAPHGKAAFAAPPEGAKGDLDPAGHWVTISGNKIHIDGEGLIDAGGHPELRKVLADKAGLAARGDAPPPDAKPSPVPPAKPAPAGPAAEPGDTPSQKRAAKGGELGPNGEWYPAGAFIATTDMPKKAKAKLDKAATGRVQVEPGRWEVPEPGALAIVSVPALNAVGGAIIKNRPQDIQDVSLAYLGISRELVEDMAARYARGERWLDAAEYPRLLSFGDAARMVKAGLPLPKGSAWTVEKIAGQLGVKPEQLQKHAEKNAAKKKA